MAKLSDYEITTFQREPGLWRASVALIDKTSTDRKMRSQLIDEDCDSEAAAELAAIQMIRSIE